MGWRLRVNFDDGSEELYNELFESEEAAYAEYETWLEGWSAGRDVLMDAGEDYCDKNLDGCDVWEE